MTLTAPRYTINCDEPDCHNSDTFLLSATDCPDLYEIRGVTQRYRFFGGETLPTGKHRCASCRAKLSPSDPPGPSQIMSHVKAIQKAFSQTWRLPPKP